MSTTPYSPRTARLPNEQLKITIEKLAQLQNSRVYGPAFLPFIFPDQFLPVPVDSNLFMKLASAKIWDSTKLEFILKPSSYSENGVDKWLNSLAKGIRECFPGQEVKRSWYAGNKMVSPEGSAIV